MQGTENIVKWLAGFYDAEGCVQQRERFCSDVLPVNEYGKQFGKLEKWKKSPKCVKRFIKEMKKTQGVGQKEISDDDGSGVARAGYSQGYAPLSAYTHFLVFFRFLSAFV